MSETLPGSGVVDRSDRQAMLAWSRIFGVHQAEIMIAVAVVGPAFEAVGDYLRNRVICFGPD